MPTLIDEISFDDGIHSCAASPDGNIVVIGSVGMIGVYEVSSTGGSDKLRHRASYIVENDFGREPVFTDIVFSECGNHLHVKTSRGCCKSLSLNRIEDGMMQEVVFSA